MVSSRGGSAGSRESIRPHWYDDQIETYFLHIANIIRSYIRVLITVLLFADTGQGLHRVQQSPRIMREIQRILVKTQSKVGSWVGSRSEIPL